MESLDDFFLLSKAPTQMQYDYHLYNDLPN